VLIFVALVFFSLSGGFKFATVSLGGSEYEQDLCNSDTISNGPMQRKTKPVVSLGRSVVFGAVRYLWAQSVHVTKCTFVLSTENV
jgi:hypothetical protein